MVVSGLGFGVWWVLSILFHLAFFGGIYVATPPAPDHASAASDEFSMKISPDRVREVVAEIRQDESQRFKERVEELLKIKQELDRLNADKVAQYNEVIKGEEPRAREKLPVAFADVVSAQKAALAAQATARTALTAFTEAQKNTAAATTPEATTAAQAAAEAAAEAALKAALAAQDAVGSAQNQAGLAQAEVATQLRLASVATATLDAHQAAANAQADASTSQGNVTAGIRQVEVAQHALTSAEETVKRQQAALQPAIDRATAAKTALAARQQALATAQGNLEAARSAATTSTEAANAAESAAAAEKKRLTELARKAATTLKREELAATKAEQNLRQTEASTKRAEDAAALQQQKTADALAVLKMRQQAVTDTVVAAMTHSVANQQASLAAQQKSLALQETANAAISKAIAAAQAGNPSPGAAAQPTVLPTATTTDARTLADFFKQAQDAEVAVAETFRNVRAAELASIRKIPLSEALAMTKVATPDRPGVNTAILQQDISSVKGVREQEKAIGAASDQMASMVALAQRMRELAAGSGANLSVAAIQAQSASNERMEHLAMEDAGAKAKDLSGEMASAGGGVHGATGNVAGATGAGGAAGGAGDGPVGSSGPAAPEGYGKPGGALGVLGIAVKNYKPLHGRTVRQGMVDIEPGRNPEWLYVDTWHLIGPWPNPGRKNLNTKFPPETVVNLDAVYQGARKNEVPIPVHWKFFQMPSKVTGKERTPAVPMIMPPGLGDYEIYYAYTELWFDAEADLWVAIGSDDQSKVWLNDLLIWKSDDTQKVWTANEGLRKVHFRKGINRVLLRLENGQNSGGFSFIVCLAADKAAGQ